MLKLFTDGGSRGNPGNSACAFFCFEDQNLFTFGCKYLGIQTNNFAEYSGLLIGITSLLKEFKNEILELEIYMDSELAVNQLNGKYKIQNENLKELKNKIDLKLEKIKNVKINHILREKNKFADKLVNICLDTIENK